jgi:TetR/AcrR family transcriptional regulator
VCLSSDKDLDPKKYIEFQVQTILNGISVAVPAGAAVQAGKKAVA